MAESTKSPLQILFLYYSFSGQTSAVLHRLAGGLESQGLDIVFEKLRPQTPLRFPFGTIRRTIRMMATTFCRCRTPLMPVTEACLKGYDLIVLAGPTWSYNPSGPVLSLVDNYGKHLFAGKEVLPVISCRSYWRTHYWGLHRMLKKCGAKVPNRIIFTHPSPEPWLTIGVFLKLAGRNPERHPFLKKRYRKYGHSRAQLDEASRLGERLGETLNSGYSLSSLTIPPI